MNLSLLLINKIFLFLSKMSLKFSRRRNKNKQQTNVQPFSSFLLMTEKMIHRFLYFLDLINYFLQ
jgi:hypothetical protein